MDSRRAGTLLAVTALTTVVVSAGCSSTEDRGPRRSTGWAVTDERRLQVLVDTCNGAPQTDVTEDDEAVTVTIVSTRRDPGDDCLDVVDVPLSAPLGDREVIDGFSEREAPPGLTRDHLQP